MVDTYKISNKDDGIRLDRWFKRNFESVPYSMLSKALRKGQIKLDGKKSDASVRVKEGQEIAIYTKLATNERRRERKEALSEYEIKETKNWVIYKDKNILAINKPYGIAVQGGSGLSDHIDRRLDALKFNAEERPKLVHRLDKDTSGVLLLARSAKAADELGKALRSRDKKINKIYHAMLTAVPEINEGEIEAALKKKGSNKEKMRIDENGLKAITRFKILERFGDRMAWVELEPITGRTHQLRVHMAEAGHPILADGKYGGKEAFIEGMGKKMHLHARKIILSDIFGKNLEIEADLPQHMRDSLKTLGIS